MFDSVAQPAIVRPRGKTVTFRVLENALHMNRATDQLLNVEEFVQRGMTHEAGPKSSRRLSRKDP